MNKDAVISSAWVPVKKLDGTSKLVSPEEILRSPFEYQLAEADPLLDYSALRVCCGLLALTNPDKDSSIAATEYMRASIDAGSLITPLPAGNWDAAKDKAMPWIGITFRPDAEQWMDEVDPKQIMRKGLKGVGYVGFPPLDAILSMTAYCGANENHRPRHGTSLEHLSEAEFLQHWVVSGYFKTKYHNGNVAMDYTYVGPLAQNSPGIFYATAGTWGDTILLNLPWLSRPSPDLPAQVGRPRYNPSKLLRNRWQRSGAIVSHGSNGYQIGVFIDEREQERKLTDDRGVVFVHPHEPHGFGEVFFVKDKDYPEFGRATYAAKPGKDDSLTAAHAEWFSVYTALEGERSDGSNMCEAPAMQECLELFPVRDRLTSVKVRMIRIRAASHDTKVLDVNTCAFQLPNEWLNPLGDDDLKRIYHGVRYCISKVESLRQQISSISESAEFNIGGRSFNANLPKSILSTLRPDIKWAFAEGAIKALSDGVTDFTSIAQSGVAEAFSVARGYGETASLLLVHAVTRPKVMNTMNMIMKKDDDIETALRARAAEYDSADKPEATIYKQKEWQQFARSAVNGAMAVLRNYPNSRRLVAYTDFEHIAQGVVHPQTWKTLSWLLDDILHMQRKGQGDTQSLWSGIKEAYANDTEGFESVLRDIQYAMTPSDVSAALRRLFLKIKLNSSTPVSPWGYLELAIAMIQVQHPRISSLAKSFVSSNCRLPSEPSDRNAVPPSSLETSNDHVQTVLAAVTDRQ